MGKNVVLLTLTDLVNLIVSSNEYTNKQRWHLRSSTNDEWIDPATGTDWYPAEWGDESPDPLYRPNLTDGNKNERKHRSELVNVQSTTFTLVEATSGSYHHYDDVIELSAELGQMMFDVWEKDHRYGNVYLSRTSRPTLLGIAKKLGVTGLDKQIKTLFSEARAAEAKRNRNSRRQNVITKIETLLNGNGGWDKGVAEYADVIDPAHFAALKVALETAKDALLKSMEA